MIYQTLIVDDEEIVCRGLKEFVKWREHGFEVADIAYSVDEALAVLEKKEISLIVTDIKMPQKTGLDLLKIVAQKYPEIKVVILSGHSDFQFAKTALQYKAVDYLTKPVNLKEVEELLDKIYLQIEQDVKSAAVQKRRMESVLLSMAKGYLPYEKEGNQIPEIERWYGIAIGLKKKEYSFLKETMEEIHKQLVGVLQEAIILPYETAKIFIVLPVKSIHTLDEVLMLLSNMISEDKECFWGISNLKFGMEKITEGFCEANQALNYMLVRQKGDIIYYKNIETLYEVQIPDMGNFLNEIMGKITDHEGKEQALTSIADYLSGWYMKNKEFSQFQIMCIRGLIEIKGLLQNIQSYTIEDEFNQVLSSLMSSKTYQQIEKKVIDYISSLITIIDQESEVQLNTGVIREVQLYLHQHFDENVSLQILAKEFYLHPNYLSRLFKEKTGENFVDYLTKIRMNKVKELLRTTNYKIVEICEMVGYENPRYFSKAFKQFTGRTPKEYRNEKEE